MHIRNLGYHFPLQTRGPKPPFRRYLRVNLTAYIFGTKHDINKRADALQTTKLSYIISKRYELWPTNGLNLEVSSHPSPKVWTPLHCHASQTEISKHNWTELWQTVDGKSR